MFTSAALNMHQLSKPDQLDRSGVFTVREHAGVPLSTQGAAGASSLKFEDFAPVRSTTAYKGQRNFSGEWWCSTNHRMVPYESWLERDHLVRMDFAPTIVGVASQPFRIDFNLPEGRRWHVPDYFVRLDDGSALVVDVRPDSRIKDRDRTVFEATDGLCQLLGWSYKRVGELPRVYMANLRWLSGYRHPRCQMLSTAASITEFLNAAHEPSTIGQVAAVIGDPVIVYPTLFHLMWRGTVTAELHTAPLGPHSILRIAGSR